VEGSVFHGCIAGETLFFSTAVEPSAVNAGGQIAVYGTGDGDTWQRLLAWPKDRWPMAFQFGTAVMPSGTNGTSILALTTIAAAGADGVGAAWHVDEYGPRRFETRPLPRISGGVA
jgi:hypothetical protein